MQIKCANPKCSYVWEYKGLSVFYATCPRCLIKVKVIEMEEKEDGLH